MEASEQEGLATRYNQAADDKYTKHTITVADLIEELKECPPSAIVVMSKDAGGNGFSPYYGLSLNWYTPESTWSGELHEVYDGPSFDGIEDDEDIHHPQEGKDLFVVCLGPVN